MGSKGLRGQIDSNNILIVLLLLIWCLNNVALFILPYVLKFICVCSFTRMHLPSTDDLVPCPLWECDQLQTLGSYFCSWHSQCLVKGSIQTRHSVSSYWVNNSNIPSSGFHSHDCPPNPMYYGLNVKYPPQKFLFRMFVSKLMTCFSETVVLYRGQT